MTTQSGVTAATSGLTGELRARLMSRLPGTNCAALIVAKPENVAYLTGYRSMAWAMRREPTMVAGIDSSGELYLAGPAADAGVVLHDGVVSPDHYIPYGRFYFETANDSPAARMSGVHPTLQAAATELLDRLGPAEPLGADDVAVAAVSEALAIFPTVDVSRWILELRACKMEGEVELLQQAARLTEDAIDHSLEGLRPGVTEQSLARRVAGHMAEGGGTPRFVVVTSGERSALADARATDREIGPGDLVRFDVGCTLGGYWSDLGRTVVLGSSDANQKLRYQAILAGEQAQIDAARPGITAAELFEVAVATVESHGLRPYSRHHCGHGIGREIYEPPLIAPGWTDELREGMTFCLETPFYELGWGGMMVEDTVVITDDGCRLLNTSDRELRTI